MGGGNSEGSRNKKKSGLITKLMLGAAVLSFVASFMSLILSGAVVVVLPAAAASAAWDRVTSLFTDPDWQAAVRRISSYQLPTDREDLFLYKPLWVDGTRVPELDTAHWINYGKLDYVYKVTPGKHTYMIDIGREALLSQVFMLAACKNCQINGTYVADKPLDPATHQPMSPDQIATYYAPTGPNFDAGTRPLQRLAVANSIGGDDATPLAPTGARYFVLMINSTDLDCYLGQLIGFPIGQRSNVLWAAQPTFDNRYRSLYDGRVIVGLGNRIPAGYDAFGQRPIHDDTLLPPLSYYQPLVDGKPQNYTSIYPVIGSDPTNPQAGDGSCLDANAGYQTVYVEWKLPAEATGKLDSLELDWLTSPTYTGATAPFGGTNPVAADTTRAPYAKQWALYLLDSHNGVDQSILNAMFNPATPLGAEASAEGLLSGHLYKRYSAAIPNNRTSISGDLGLPRGDTHDTIIVAFEKSSYTAPHPPDVFFPDPTPQPTPLPLGATPGPTPTPTGTLRDLCDPGNASYLTNANKPGPPAQWPNQLAGLPADWLSLGELVGYEQKPATPEKWPVTGTNAYNNGVGWTGAGGAFDLRYGTCTSDKIEQILTQFPWRGIDASGNSAGLAPTPSKLTGLGTVFVEMGNKYHINPCYGVAWARKETSLGTTGYHVYNASTGVWGYNLYGMTGTGWVTGKCIAGMSGRFCGYASFQDSIEDFFGLLSEGYVQGQSSFLSHDGTGQGQQACPCATVERILPWYAPYFENDTALYIQQIENWITEWGAAAPAQGWPGGGQLGIGSGTLLSQLDRTQYVNDSQFYAYKESTCGITSATMVLNSLYGTDLRIGDVLNVAIAAGSISASDGTLNWNYITSANISDLIAGSGGGGPPQFHTFTSNDPNDYLRNFRDMSSQGVPVIANVLDSYYYAGHFFVVMGYDATDDTFQVNDPYSRQLPGNPPGIRQKWPASRLGSIIRLGYPSIILTRSGSGAAPITAIMHPSPAQAGDGSTDLSQQDKHNKRGPNNLPDLAFIGVETSKRGANDHYNANAKGGVLYA